VRCKAEVGLSIGLASLDGTRYLKSIHRRARRSGAIFFWSLQSEVFKRRPPDLLALL
jgi:hypothetical protein